MSRYLKFMVVLMALWAIGMCVFLLGTKSASAEDLQGVLWNGKWEVLRCVTYYSQPVEVYCESAHVVCDWVGSEGGCRPRGVQ